MTCLLASVRFLHSTELFSAIADNRNARDVMQSLSTELKTYLDESNAPVGPHTADQLLLPLALTSGGQFRATELTEHFLTNIRTIEAFFGKGYIEWVKVAEGEDGMVSSSSGEPPLSTASASSSSAAAAAATATNSPSAAGSAVPAIGAPCRLGYKVTVRPFPLLA